MYDYTITLLILAVYSNICIKTTISSATRSTRYWTNLHRVRS